MQTPLNWGIHVAKNSGYKTIEDLKGKKAAINRYGSGSHLMAFINEYHQQKHFLGVCLGHQALAEYFGATLKNFTTPFHGEKTIVTQQSASKIWNNLPASFEVGLYHSWYVSEDNLPEEINIVAKSREGIIMALEHEKWPLYGVQFHPESYMSEQGLELIRNFLAE